MIYTFNVGRLLARLSRAEKPQVAIARELSELGGDPVKPVAVERWRERNSIPMHRLADILMVARKRKLGLNLSDYIVTQEAFDAARNEEGGPVTAGTQSKAVLGAAPALAQPGTRQ